MAWVRPKHKPKPKADPAESLIPMLSYFSGTPRHNLRPISTPPKALPAVAPISHDPILRSLQQAQALQHQESAADHHTQRREEPETQSRRQKHLHRPVLRDEEEIYEYQSEHELMPHQNAPSPSREISPRRPRVPSYERSRPPPAIVESRHKYTSSLRHRPYMPSSSTRVSSRMASSRWANATTPLDI